MCFELQHASTGTPCFFPMSLSVQAFEFLKNDYVCILILEKHVFDTVLVYFLWFLAVRVCVHKSFLNAFPRSDLVGGNVVTHQICCPA